MALRLYEVLVLVDPRLGDEEVAQLSGGLQEVFSGLGGELVSAEPWGKRRLTYEVRKQREGSYVLLTVRATAAVIREFERQLKLNESVARFMTTRATAGGPAGVAAEAGPGREPTVQAVEEVG
jgi:small subunit ribosomal protein S6